MNNSIRNTISFLTHGTKENDVLNCLLNKGLLDTADVENIKVIVQNGIKEVSEILKDSVLFSINGRGMRRMKPLNIAENEISGFASFNNLLTAPSVLVFKSKEDLNYSGLKRVLSNMGVGYYTHIEEMPAISEEAFLALEERKDKFGYSCKFYNINDEIEYDKEARRNSRKSNREASHNRLEVNDFNEEISYKKSIEDVIDFANGKQIVYILSERSDVLPYVSEGKILFTSEYGRLPGELIRGIFENEQRNIILLKCSKTTAKNLKIYLREGFIEYTEWFRNKFMEVYGNIDFSYLPEFKSYNKDKYFLKDLSVKDIANIYYNFLEVATEEDLKTDFFKLLNSEIGNAAEALKVIVNLGESFIIRDWFAKYLKSIQVDKEFSIVETVCSTEFTEKYPMLQYVKFSSPYYYSSDCAELIKTGVNDNYCKAPRDEILARYREVLDYVLEVEKAKKSTNI